jgi:hypothetical protein
VRKDGSLLWAVGEMSRFATRPECMSASSRSMRDRTAQKQSEVILVEQTRALELLNRVGSALAVESDTAPLMQVVTDAGVELSWRRVRRVFLQRAGRCRR